jgi:hypothetical protein
MSLLIDDGRSNSNNRGKEVSRAGRAAVEVDPQPHTHTHIYIHTRTWWGDGGEAGKAIKTPEQREREGIGRGS